MKPVSQAAEGGAQSANRQRQLGRGGSLADGPSCEGRRAPAAATSATLALLSLRRFAARR